MPVYITIRGLSKVEASRILYVKSVEQAFIISFFAILSWSCNQKGHFEDSHLVDVGAAGSGIPSEGCTDEALIALNEVTSVCDRDLTTDQAKELCASSTEDYKIAFPNVVCNLEGEVVVTEKFIEEELEPIVEEKDPLQEFIESGVFDY